MSTDLPAFFLPCKTCDGHPPAMPLERAKDCLHCGKYRRQREKETGRMSAKEYKEYVEGEKNAGRGY